MNGLNNPILFERCNDIEPIKEKEVMKVFDIIRNLYNSCSIGNIEIECGVHKMGWTSCIPMSKVDVMYTHYSDECWMYETYPVHMMSGEYKRCTLLTEDKKNDGYKKEQQITIDSVGEIFKNLSLSNIRVGEVTAMGFEAHIFTYDQNYVLTYFSDDCWKIETYPVYSVNEYMTKKHNGRWPYIKRGEK